MRRFCFLSLLLTSTLILSSSTALAENNWPGWRGPLGTGHSNEKGLPVEWSQDDVVWKTELPGFGQSSPVVWKDRIFLTSALENGRQRIVFCVERASGKILWQQVAWNGSPEQTHKMNMFASATCVTDGERVVAFFGRGGLHSYDLDGKHQWSCDLGQFAGPWGTAASPIIVGDLVIQNCDAEEESFIAGVNKKTGKEVWRTPREKLRGWSTPIVVETKKRTEVVLNGERGIDAYDPVTGKHLWFCRGDKGRGTPTVVPYKGLLIAVAGRPGDMVAVRPGGEGTVNNTHEVWRTTRRGGRDLPSPIVVGDILFVANLRPGTGTCYDAGSGKELCVERLGGNFSATPITAGGLIYLPSESGETLVIRPGKTMEIVARNEVGAGAGEIFRASLTPCDGQLFCRSNRVLYCIGKGSGE